MQYILYAEGFMHHFRVGVINIDTNNPELDAVQSPAGIVSNYSLEYMIKVIRSIGKASNVVNMEYDSEKPMRLDFEMPSNTKVQYYLAPRIKSPIKILN